MNGWMKKRGLAGVRFFLINGLLGLLIPLLLVLFGVH